jgi:hypothetical protein
MNQYRATHNDGSKGNIYPDVTPDTCPICHYKIVPEFCVAYYFSKNHFDDYDIIWRCANQHCYRLFISHHINGKLINSLPKEPELIEVDKDILKISSRFYQVYKQALVAKSHDLLEISGMALRKALEILIKDYCIYKEPSMRDEIIKKKLITCINDYCQGRIKSSADKCRELGNDESHYEKKYEQLDVSDLEKLIAITMHWVSAELKEASYDEIL